MSDNTISPEQQNRDRNRKRKALLAGGVVLGIGAAATLAAFTDGEFARGEFSTGAFNIVGSTDGTNFEDHTTAEGATTLSFSQNASDLTPGDVVYASYFIKTDEDSLAGKLTEVDPVKTGGLKDVLTATATYSDTSGTCDAEFGDTTIPNLEAAGANTVQVCLKVALSNDQGAVETAAATDSTGAIVWEWTAESA